MTRGRHVVLSVLVFIGGSLTIARAEYSITDLVDAAKRGDYHAVHKLLENETDLDARGPMGYTALRWAGIRGHWRIFAELVAAGAPVNAVGSDGGYSRIDVYDATSGQRMCRLTGHDGLFPGLAFALDGLLYSYDLQGVIRAWNIEHQREQWCFYTLAWASDNRCFHEAPENVDP